MITKSTKSNAHHKILKSAWLDTVLGSMLTISDDKQLYLLEFSDSRGLEREIEKLMINTQATITPGSTAPIQSITAELDAYFNGSLFHFTTPIHLIGSPFQKLAWEALRHIPYGQTSTYKNQATTIGKIKAYRAVANANGANQLSIIVPCHRIINSNGKLGGYGGGISRKKWLINHENRNV